MTRRGSDPHERRRLEAATRRAAQVRDAGLARISRATRWMIAGAVALSGAFALIAAGAFHGRTVGATSSSAGSQSQSQPAATGSQPSLAQPAQAQAPTPTPAAPVVVSGGS